MTGQNPGFGFSYDTLSRRTSVTRPNGVNTTYSYDSVSRLLSVLHQAGPTTLDGLSYTYDNAGNRASKTDLRTNVTSNYGYDNIYQLMEVTQGASTTENYTYDLVGNRLSSLGVSPYSYNSSNELTSTPSTTYTYDYNSNTLSKTDSTGTTSYASDYENRLKQVTLPGSGGIVNFKYDPLGRRAQKSFTQGSTTTTTNYLYDGADLIEEIDNSGNVLGRYTQGPMIDEPLSELRSGTTSYYGTDGIGSVTSLSSANAALANTYSYDSYGRLIASTGTLTNSLHYTARELDSETGIHFYRARYYDPNTGRFISEDPIQFKGGINFYAYAKNSPTDLTDPTGLKTRVCCRPAVFKHSGEKHCFIVITNNPDVNHGNQQTYSLFPAGGLPWTYGEPSPNDPRDTGPLNSGQTSCSDVPGCNSCKERQIPQNASNAGPSAEYWFLGPNSNSYVYYQLTHAGCTPPAIPNTPGYHSFPPARPAPDQHGFGGPW